MKFHVDTFGCRTNQAEIQDWIIDLENAGYRLVSSIDEADFGVINTCSVTEKAEKDVLRRINKVYHKTNRPWVVTGCTVEKEKKRLAAQYRHFIFLDNGEKQDLVASIKDRFPIENGNLIYHSAFRSRIFLKVQDGCNLRCAFCIVPRLRGKSRSVPPDVLQKKCAHLVSLGYREIVLSGINLSAYGYDLFPRENLLNLVKRLADNEGLEFIRLSSLDPRYIEFTFIKELAALEKVAHSFHFSFQSGSGAVLRRMNRRSKIGEYRKIMNDFIRFFPDANYGADILVGFPEETEKEFQETVTFVGELPLNYLHVFPFSPRAGTRAAALPTLPPAVVRKRTRALRELDSQMRLGYRERFVDRVLDGILIEENPHYALAVTTNFLTVRVAPVKGYKKRKIRVRIRKVINEKLCEGEVVHPAAHRGEAVT